MTLRNGVVSGIYIVKTSVPGYFFFSIFVSKLVTFINRIYVYQKLRRYVSEDLTEFEELGSHVTFDTYFL